jgi:predicted nucleotidyltransferase
MPLRSLRSSVLKWPDRETVLAAARAWATLEAGKHPEALAIGCFGSYARGNWGVGSDLDLLAIVSHCAEPFERRALGWKVEDLPVPAEILIYTIEEWERLSGEKSRFARVLKEDTQWLWSRDELRSLVQVVSTN